MHRIRHLLKVILIGAFILAFFFLLLFVMQHFQPFRSPPIKTINMLGVRRLDPTEVKNIITPLVNRGFFTVNVEYIKERLQQLPWISRVSVRRTWPDQVEISVIEKNAVALWNEKSLLSDEGELFTPRRASFPDHLPQFIGPEGQQIVMLKHYRDMNRLFIPLHVNIACLELTPYLTWKLKLDNGILLQIGYQDILTKLDHFVKVYNKIVGNHAEDVVYIDLRYSNGIAVRWREKNVSHARVV